MNWMNENSTVIPTVKPGIQKITITGVEDKSDEKGNRVLVTFTCGNKATLTKMFFEKSIITDNLKEADMDYQHMLAQLGYEAGVNVKPANVLKKGNSFYANVRYGIDAQGYSRAYPNIMTSEPTEATEAAID